MHPVIMLFLRGLTLNYLVLLKGVLETEPFFYANGYPVPIAVWMEVLLTEENPPLVYGLIRRYTTVS